MTLATSARVCGTCCPDSLQAAFTSSVILAGARNLSSLQSTIDVILHLDAISQISPKPSSPPISFFTDWIIHSPMMFFK